MAPRTHEEFNDTNANHMIVSYGTDAYDFRALSPAAALKVLEAAPYAGNLYARVIKESIGRARIGIAAFEEHVRKRIQDPEWKELLVHAPRRAIEAYTASAARAKAEIARAARRSDFRWILATRKKLVNHHGFGL